MRTRSGCRIGASVAAALAGFLTAAAAARANTLYVSPGGSDSNPGTSALPFRQIRAGVAVAGAGDTVLVADGTYLGFDVVSKTGTAVAPITIRAPGRAADVTVTTDRSDNRDSIRVSFSSYVVLDGLRGSGAI